MNLIIDMGNSRTKFSVFHRGDVLFTVPVEEFSAEHVQLLKNEHPSLDQAILSSTRPYPGELLQTLNEIFKKVIILDHNTPIPIENCYKTKETLGKDRLAAAVGAWDLYPGNNILVIDAGTAITYDLINEKGQFLGGNISPGLEMRFSALHQFTGNLPQVKPKEFPGLFGTSTEEAMLAGVQNGIVFEVDRTIELFNDFYSNLKVIITGGNAEFFDNKLKSSFFVRFNLVAIGLNRILEYNGDI